MNTILYMQTDKNVRIDDPEVFLKDIAQLQCSDPAIFARMQTIRICDLRKVGYGKYPVTVSDILSRIQHVNPQVEVVPIGEPSVVLTYERQGERSGWRQKGKIVFVWLVTFFGTAFSIMTFHTDVGIRTLFREIYEGFTGLSYTGFTILEISYSLGIGVGALFFFNHFGKKRFTKDPTPMEVEMKTYEDTIDDTLISQRERKEKT